MTRGTDEQLDELHALTAEVMASELKRYCEAVDAEGKPAPQPIPPALLGQVIKFLRDNGIDAPSRAAPLRDELTGALPVFDEDPSTH